MCVPFSFFFSEDKRNLNGLSVRVCLTRHGSYWIWHGYFLNISYRVTLFDRWIFGFVVEEDSKYYLALELTANESLAKLSEIRLREIRWKFG